MDTPYPEIQADLPPILCKTVTVQSHLGWDQLYHGHVCHLWEHAIDQLNPHLPTTGCHLMTQMIKSVWTYFLATWTLCNQHLHNDAGKLSQPNYQQAVQTMYETKNNSPSTSRMPSSTDHWRTCWNNLQQHYTPGSNAANAIVNNNSKQPKNMQNSRHSIFVCFSDVLHCQQMIYTHHRSPDYTAPVWVFCV